jgi:hypothetical protein
MGTLVVLYVCDAVMGEWNVQSKFELRASVDGDMQCCFNYKQTIGRAILLAKLSFLDYLGLHRRLACSLSPIDLFGAPYSIAHCIPKTANYHHPRT